MASDQELMKQLQQRLRDWSPDRQCSYHMGKQCCTYDDQGQLIELHLCQLGLTQVPWEVWQCSTLQRLFLTDNQLSTLSVEVGKLTALQWLNLTDNQLSTLPVEVGKLIALQWLFLTDNQLSTLPVEVGKLTALQTLSLFNNQLSTLPVEVGKLTELQDLFLFNNQLSTLPVEVGKLTELQDLFLRNNPLQTPPPEIVSQGIPAILAYLQTLQQAPVERFEAKVILIGEGGMGKTSLLRNLQGKDFVERLPVTHGIEIAPLYAPHPHHSQQHITLYTWDFGGQDIYQATHQFFLTQRSVYLLLWNARLGAEACRLPFWLETIKGHAPDAKILLVSTHSDLWTIPTINLSSYQQRYPQIVGQCTISNLTGSGLDNLRAQLLAAVLQTPFVGQKWPLTWVQAEQELLARPEHHIDHAIFVIACSQHKIESETERETFGRYLHDLGKILYFYDDPILKTLIVLKPNWISKAISRVLLDPHVQQSGGVLEHRELPRIWATDEHGQPYPRALYPIFVRMMERFELCYQLEPDRPGQPITQSLIPQLLPNQPPASLSPIPTVPGTGQVLVEMRYTLSFVPAGLMSWFLVRTHRYSQRQHWREGARLVYGGQQAHIELDASQREISIRVWGPFPYTFLLILKQTLDDLLQAFQGLRVQRKIPCRCSMQQQISHTHNYEDLERQLTRGLSEITCSEGMPISLALLLYGIHSSTIPQMVATVQKTQQLLTQNLQLDPKMHQMSDDELRRSLVRFDQGLEFMYRIMLNQDQWRRKVEQEKLSNTCPSLFVLERTSRSLINPHDWVSHGCRLRLLCQYPQGPHTIAGEQSYEVRQGKEWWNAMSPWLRRMVKVLEVGIPLGKAINEGFNLVDIKRFIPEIDFLKEILGALPEISVVDAQSNAQLDTKVQTTQQVEGPARRALFHFLDTSDPAHRWQGLSPVITDDGTILWLCKHHLNMSGVHPLIEMETL
jgi:internalin A